VLTDISNSDAKKSKEVEKLQHLLSEIRSEKEQLIYITKELGEKIKNFLVLTI